MLTLDPDRPHRRCQKVNAIARHHIPAIYLDIRAATTHTVNLHIYIPIYFLSGWLVSPLFYLFLSMASIKG